MALLFEGGGLSHDNNKKERVDRRMKVSDLKKICSRRDLVEVWDVTSADPKLLVFLKSYRNSVPVPRHWSQKRKYLQGKHGIEKQRFRLPDFIAAMRIDKIREGYIQKQEKLKQKQREKMMHPKMGRTDIDFRVLHDAFFKYQTKPNLTAHGDIYYEGRGRANERDEASDADITAIERSKWYDTRRRSSPVAHQYAETWSTTFLSKLENSWGECSYSSRS